MDSFPFTLSYEGLEDVLLCNINEVGRLEILSLWLKNIPTTKYDHYKNNPGIIQKGCNQSKGTEQESCRCMIFFKFKSFNRIVQSVITKCN